MTIPDYQKIMLPLLRCLKDKDAHKISELVEKLSEEFKLTDEEKNMMYESGNAKVFRNRVRWSRLYLKKAGLIRDPKRGYLIITDIGLEALKSEPEKIDMHFLKKYPGFVESEKGITDVPEYILDSEGGAFSKETPDDLIEKGNNEIVKNLKQELLKLLKKNSSEFFEDTVVKVLKKMGYGEGEVTGKTGDRGIDGIIYRDELRLEIILIQAKRYDEKKVTASDIRDFAGALDSKRTNKGVFFTTSDFTEDAKKESLESTKNIQLINGEKLVELMIKYNVGVTTRETYEIKEIDSDFFIEM